MRPYKEKKFQDLLVSLFVTKTVSNKNIVNSLENVIYCFKKTSTTPILNYLVKNTFLKHYSAGENLSNLLVTIDNLKKKNLNSILDFALEDANTSTKDVIKQLMKTVDIASTRKNSIVAFKMTSLVDYKTLCELSKEEPKYYPNILGKKLDIIWGFFNYARFKDVCVTVDAEQSEIQPAINNITLDLMKFYNRNSDKPFIYNTYQMYLTNSLQRLQNDFYKSKKQNFCFGVKLVRGAYMISERQQAILKNKCSPVYNTVEETHLNYDKAVKFIIENSLDVIIATHNQESIYKAINIMDNLKISKQRVIFAQLFGMQDSLSDKISSLGLRTYKYVPYGNVEIMIPYLLRRAQENLQMVESTKMDNQEILKEIFLRLKLEKLFYTAKVNGSKQEDKRSCKS